MISKDINKLSLNPNPNTDDKVMVLKRKSFMMTATMSNDDNIDDNDINSMMAVLLSDGIKQQR